MPLRNDLITAARNLLIALSAATDAKVIDAGEKGPRPTLPYVTVDVTTFGGSDLYGPAERVDGVRVITEAPPVSVPQTTMRERREAVVSMQGYGSSSFEWLHDLQARLDSPTSLRQQSTDGAAALLQSPVTDLSAILDTSEERRCSLELRLRYQNLTTPVDQIEIQRTEVTLQGERYEGDPDTLTLDFALDESGDLTTPP